MDKCQPIREKLNALLDRELSIFDWLRVRMHLLHCRECQKCLLDYRRISLAAEQVRLVSVPTRRSAMPAFALSAIVLAVFVLASWPKPKPIPSQPQALVFDKASLSGNFKPTSAIYAEGDHLVIRDSTNGMVLASTHGRTKKDAFNAIVLANKVPFGEAKEVRIELSPTSGPVSISQKDPIEVILMESEGILSAAEEPVVLFLADDKVDIKTLRMPDRGPTFLVKVIDPSLFVDFEKATPTKKTEPLPNNKPEPRNR